MAASFIILILVGLGNMLLGTIVLIKNPKSKVNLTLFIFALAITAWTFTNFLTDNTQNLTLSLWSARLANFTSLSAVLTMWLFTGYFIFGEKKPARNRVLLMILPLLITLSPFGIERVTSVTTAANQDIGVAYVVVIIAFVVLFYGFAHDLYHGLRFEKDAAKIKNIKLIVAGGTAAFIYGVGANIFLPLITSSWGISKFGPIFTLILVATISVGIIKNRLFDIRMAVTRIIGYSITLSIVAVLYSLIVFGLINLISHDEVGAKEILIFIIPTVIVGFTFHRIEAFVSQHTQRVFYKDAYDVREVLDQLSDKLLAENDVDEMMQQSLSIINGALKLNNAYLAVCNSTGIIYKHKSIGLQQNPSGIEAMLNHLTSEKQALIDRQEDPESSIAKIINRENFEVLLRLGPRTKPLGILLLGAKKSGTPFNKQDVALLKISAKNLGIALDNAKKYDQILHFADTMRQEVKKATSNLRQANKELKTLDALKDDFIATASHQLRTPSASVHDALMMLNHPSLSEKDRQELIQLAEASSEHLVGVVKTMLNMARIQAGRFTIDKDDANLIELAEKTISQVKILADQKGSIIRFEKPNDPIFIRLDVAKINEAISNYLENAIKYSPEGSVITISLIRNNGKIICEVADQGMGVPEDEKAHLFEKFYRATNARQDQPEGNGIGLYVVKCIAEGHGGQAYYRPGDTLGSVFGFWVPESQEK